MASHELTTAQADDLVEELSAALDTMLDCTCWEMAPLWLEETRRAREDLGDRAIAEAGFEPSGRYRALSKGARSRYRGLAAWRHAVLWLETLTAIDGDFALALEAVYFTPYPDDTPPYAWSQSATACPGVGDFPSPSTLKVWAKEGAWESVEVLIGQRSKLMVGSRADEVRAGVLRCATRRSVRVVLKLDDHDRWVAAEKRLGR